MVKWWFNGGLMVESKTSPSTSNSLRDRCTSVGKKSWLVVQEPRDRSSEISRLIKKRTMLVHIVPC